MTPPLGDDLPHRTLSETHIGTIARELLTNASSAVVRGSSSRGVFLSLDTGWIIFLSREAYKGPLTVNLTGDFELLEGLKTEAAVKIISSEMHFSHPETILSASQARDWQATPPVGKALPLEERIRILEEIEGNASEGSRIPSKLTHTLLQLQEACRSNQLPKICQSLGDSLGWGEGLTPSGDDLVLGFLLAVNRWGELLCPHMNLAALNPQIQKLACQRTHTLSANLIACACRGQADERLVLALDGLATGSPDPFACAAALAGWGSSSGWDALVGMSILISLDQSSQ